MNRLVIIGNGFDLAHGLPTSYKDFIDDFWKNFRDKVKTEEYKKFVYANESFYQYYSDYGLINNFKDFKTKIGACINDNKQYYFDEKRLIFYTSQFSGQEVIFRFENELFSQICNKNCENWVDIENEYYRQLKTIAKDIPLDNFKTTNIDIWEQGLKRKVQKLNHEFEQVKNLLEKYLKENVVSKYNFHDYNDPRGDFFEFCNLLYPEILEEGKIENWKEEFSKSDKLYIDKLIKEGKQKEVKLHLLCFNYTPTVNRYFNYFKNNTKINTEVNYIHGQVGNNSDNKINFGFGDEMDDDYKIIENIDDNEYLTNFKSFQYLQNANYKRLLDFVESERFEVFIMGSSCGLSDRTLLNTIFENDNCRLIKVFYYKNGENDNFTELTQNISRHFNKKSLMRSKIVHKSTNQIMPKIQLPEK